MEFGLRVAECEGCYVGAAALEGGVDGPLHVVKQMDVGAVALKLRQC
jgi:hypothetical protein